MQYIAFLSSSLQFFLSAYAGQILMRSMHIRWSFWSAFFICGYYFFSSFYSLDYSWQTCWLFHEPRLWIGSLECLVVRYIYGRRLTSLFIYFADWTYSQSFCCSFPCQHWNADSCSFSLEPCWYFGSICNIGDCYKNNHNCICCERIWLQ